DDRPALRWHSRPTDAQVRDGWLAPRWRVRQRKKRLFANVLARFVLYCAPSGGGMSRTVTIGAAVVVMTVAVRAQAPKLEVDSLWPKPFPVAKHWILGSVTGVAVDAQDRIWVVHRGVDSLQANEKGPALEPWASMCCFAAPQILAFDA